jgi:glutamine amidotransferase
MSKIVIINYGIGNLTSVQNMLRKAGADDVIISSEATDICSADKLVLPGVGHFDYGMKMLIDSKLVPIIEEQIFNKKIPILGICLGAQLMTQSSEEGTIDGLGWVKGSTVSFDKSRMTVDLKVPHMGWNYVKVESNNELSDELTEESRFYFVHSYHLKMSDPKDIWLSTQYGYEFTAAFRKDNLYACQFHPEKSHKYGLKLMKNFVNL